MRPNAPREQQIYLPDPAEIEAQCQAIRRSWSRRTLRNRGSIEWRVHIPEVKAAQLQQRRKPLS